MNNIGGFGLKIILIAKTTFPMGFEITQFADDADPFDSPAIKIKETAMGLNGDLITWSKAAPVPMTINVIPHSDDDLNLNVIQRVNKVGLGKAPFLDELVATIVFPDGTAIILNNGVMTDGPSISSVASSGRLKTNTYSFTFESAI